MVKSRIEKLDNEIKNCRRCPLWKGAKNAVPGEGPANAKVMFFGEAPGREESLTGKPFVGRSGKLLTQLLEENGVNRDKVFITSILKHRPPNNRQPKKCEIKACEIWWRKQIEIVRPKIIVVLGRFAFDTIVNEGKSLSRSRGEFLTLNKEWGEQKFFITFHPSAGLRFVKFKEILRKDFRKLAKKIKSF
ncbi:MAG: uracil-DNA glycosylase [Candidatus Pacebacteria bacterium]|nr:uracil-DNA glycosylase [Candidatus Paceibacterota bacterium]